MNDTTRLALRPLGAALGGIVVAGLGIGATALIAGAVDSDSGWGDLAVVAVGTLLSVGLGVLTWLGMLVAAARRTFPPGARLAPVVQSAGAVLAFLILVSAAQSAGVGKGGTPVVQLAAIAVLVLPPAVFIVRGRMTPRPGPPAEWPLPPR